jgi:Glycosyl hydrolase family 26
VAERRRAAARLAGAMAVLVVAAGTGGGLYAYAHYRMRVTPAPAHSPRPTASASASAAATARSFHLGIFQSGVTASYQPVQRFAKAVGETPDIVLYYNNWDQPFSLSFADRAAAHGAVPFVQLEPLTATMASIAAGASDTYLDAYAKRVRTFGHPVILSFASEMNGRWYPWGWTKTAPTVWVAAWRHVVTLFRQQGAHNVTWMWTISHDIANTGPLSDYWPGSKYVDWVGIDGYYFLSSDDFASVFGAQIKKVRELTNTPIFLSEVGIGQIANQEAKLPGLFAGIRQYHLLGLLWFDVPQHDGLYHQNWQLEGNAPAVAEFRAGLRSLSAT